MTDKSIKISELLINLFELSNKKIFKDFELFNLFDKIVEHIDKSIKVSKLLVKLLERANENEEIFKDFELFNLFDKIEQDLEKHNFYFPKPRKEYKHELNYPNATIERLEDNLNKIYKLIMLKYN
jgi:hypothetical protein